MKWNDSISQDKFDKDKSSTNMYFRTVNICTALKHGMIYNTNIVVGLLVYVGVNTEHIFNKKIAFYVLSFIIIC